MRFLPALLAFMATAWFWSFLPAISAGETRSWAWAWLPDQGVELALRIDGLSLLFALLITGIGTLIFLYTAAYFRNDDRLPRLLTLLMLFGISMLGLVLADDAISLFVFWEGTTVTSFLLVGFDHNRRYARASALQALIITGLGGLALLAGLIILGQFAGTYRLSEMVLMGDAIRASEIYIAATIFVLLGCFTKSAQFPFHFWLPGAMAAPTPVSAYLHSATMVKAGVYLLMRMSPALGGTEIWMWSLTICGAITMIVGSVWAMKQDDLKLMLAHTTLMGLGALVMLLGSGTKEAAKAAVLFLLVHALYKAALFLSVGILDKQAGSRMVDDLGGLRGAMPLSFAIAALAALSMAGFPPFIGFIGKEVIYESALHSAASPLLVTGSALAANIMMVACAGLVAIKPYFGERRAQKNPGDPVFGLWFGPAVLAALGLWFGLFPAALGHDLLEPALGAVTGKAAEVKLYLWHGVNLPFLLSLLTFAAGIGLFLVIGAVRRALQAARVPGAEDGYDLGLAGIDRLSAWVTRSLQGGRMTVYLKLSFAVFAGVIWMAILMSNTELSRPDFRVPLFQFGVVVLILVSTVVVTFTPSRLIAICALGGVGSGIAMLFVMYGAIDVAMTQLLVEILVVVFFAIALLQLPRTPISLGFRPFDMALSVALGLGVIVTLWAVLGTELNLYLTEYFEKYSAPKALGRNIVNVILVDFRALDTLGEVSVVLIAAIAAVAVMRAGREARK
ncbi:hydrogen gas-evolving membrane-bound hydrogenase subunit E [Oceanomicrobium pacificus]|uniref:DUF4040 domain-containing protein n=1 Tax=Oceanomicrobium pacificus TaxID=2692916 RepID=A0A6B0TS83_9RHOB|nr:hydrogen gas-evolving membrane-bound hydrogenase subunit E [Oceanomicrobium pacificus]MXU63873.1 DUF4040 domain-containing protein [Oceanomicrobium pacificus]